MFKAGILVNKLDFSQQSLHLIMSVNKLLYENPTSDFIVFYETWGRQPLAPKFATMMERECWGLEGTLISTTLINTSRAIRCPGPTKKLFYVWNLEWLNLQNINFEELAKIYCHPTIELVARSESHYKALKDVWKEPIAIMDNFNPTVLKELIS